MPLEMKKASLTSAIVLTAITVVVSSPAQAGPPFITDDPVPVDYRHWEIYGFSAATHVRGDTGGTLIGTEINYGPVPNVMVHMIAPLAFDAPNGNSMQVGRGDVELGIKYRFVSADSNDWGLQIGTFPLVEVPTGDAKRGLGADLTTEFIPIWIQKDFGRWTTYGGGGYWHNPGVGNKDYWFVGWLLQRQVTHNLALGGEIFHQTADTVGGRGSSGFNVGGVYDFSQREHLLFSFGRGLENVTASNELSYYLALQWTI